MSLSQIPSDVRQAFADQGIKLDMLGQPLSKNDQVLVKSYGSATHDTIANIKRVNRVNLVIDVDRREFDSEHFQTWQDANPGKYWWKAADRNQFYKTYTQEMSRHPSDVVKFDKQAEIAKSEYSKLVDAYPECFI